MSVSGRQGGDFQGIILCVEEFQTLGICDTLFRVKPRHDVALFWLLARPEMPMRRTHATLLPIARLCNAPTRTAGTTPYSLPSYPTPQIQEWEQWG